MQLKLRQNHHMLLAFGRLQKALRLARKRRGEVFNVVQTFSVLNVLPWKRALSAASFFYFSGSKSGLKKKCFWCILTWKFASRRIDVHVFYMTTSKNAPTWCVLYIWTWTCVSRHISLHFWDVSSSEMCFAPRKPGIFHFIWPDGCGPVALPSYWFDPSKPQIVEKQMNHDFPLLFRASSIQLILSPALLFYFLSDLHFFSSYPCPSFSSFFLFSSLLIFFTSCVLFSSFLFFESSHLWFSICQYCWKFDFWISFDN